MPAWEAIFVGPLGSTTSGGKQYWNNLPKRATVVKFVYSNKPRQGIYGHAIMHSSRFDKIYIIIVCLNPFAPRLLVPVHTLSTASDLISFNGHGQLCPLTCVEWRDLSNHTRMSTIQSRTPEKKAKHHVTLTWKFPRNLVPLPTYLSFLLIS